jgi:hypothetical protein
MDNFITCYMAGRLGNQMFEIANVYAQALRHNRSFRLTTTNGTGDLLLYKDSMFRKLQFRSDAHVPNMHYITGTYHYTEYKPHDILPTAFMGYYQSEKFFKDYSENIKWLYEPTEEFVKRAYEDYPQLGYDNTVAIHIRRGDFVIQTDRFPLVTKEYVFEALKQIPDKTYCFVISDDILWCKENLKGENFIYPDYCDPAQALWFMSLCKNFIISNSTFSWWGAYLSKEKNKKVVHPSTWFGPGFQPVENWDSGDVYCENWICIPTKYSEPGLIVPV